MEPPEIENPYYGLSEWESESLHWMGRILSGEYCHYCPEWDYLPIDETCDEFECCVCSKEEIRKLNSVSICAKHSYDTTTIVNDF